MLAQKLAYARYSVNGLVLLARMNHVFWSAQLVAHSLSSVSSKNGLPRLNKKSGLYVFVERINHFNSWLMSWLRHKFLIFYLLNMIAIFIITQLSVAFIPERYLYPAHNQHIHAAD